LKIKIGLISLFKGLAIVLSFTILFPSVVKLTHSFNHHKHQQICDEGINHTTHFHVSDLDCDFYKFKLSKIQFFDFQDYTEKPEVTNLKKSTKYYISYHNNQQLTRFLRGPPQLM
jgi:hypothetical protein